MKKTLLFWFIFMGLAVAQENYVLRYTLSYSAEEKESRQITEYYAPKMFSREFEGNFEVIRSDLKKLLWYQAPVIKDEEIREEEIRAERTFEQQNEAHKIWKSEVETLVRTWKNLQKEKTDPQQIQALQHLIDLQQLSYSLKRVGEEKWKSYSSYKYQVYWGKKLIGTLWESKEFRFSKSVPFTLLDGEIHPLNRLREQLNGVLLKWQIEIPSVNPKKKTIQTLELQSLEEKEPGSIEPNKFDP